MKLFKTDSLIRKKIKKNRNSGDGSCMKSADLPVSDFKRLLGKLVKWDDLRNGNFAMWHPCSEDALFSSSPVRDMWTKMYAVTENCSSYITADLLKAYGIIEGGISRFVLTDELLTFPFLTSAGYQVILSISKDKGIRFHFKESAPFTQRLDFMYKFYSYCNDWNDIVIIQKREKDRSREPGEWWDTAVDAAIDAERFGPVIVGQIVK